MRDTILEFETYVEIPVTVVCKKSRTNSGLMVWDVEDVILRDKRKMLREIYHKYTPEFIMEAWEQSD